MSEQSVVGVYSSMEQVEDAVRKLDKGGFPITQVSVIAKDLESEKQVHGYVSAGDVAKRGAASGAWFGGLFGLLVGSAFIWVPGFGPLMVAGAFAAALLGTVEGAAAGAVGGALLGALAGWGVSKRHIVKYEQDVRSGKYLVIAHGSAAEADKARGILGGTTPEALDRHGETSA